ncbi:MAG: glycosyltransferase family 39 protein [Devosia sp.]
MRSEPPAMANGLPRALLIVIAVTTLVRLALAGLLDLGADESYALAVSVPLQLSFFDHPPLAFWIAGVMQALFGRDIAPMLLRLPFILMFAGSTWAMFALTRRFYGERAGVWAAGLLNTAPFFFLSAGSWVVPDGPLVLALLLAALCFAKALDADGGAWRYWLGTGLFAGLALLSKYQAIVVIAGALLVLAMPAYRRWLRTAQPYVAVVLAAVLFGPVLWWNVQNDWVSVAFQLGRGNGATHHDPLRALTVFTGEAIYLLPWLLVGLVVAAIRARGAGAHLFLPLALPLIVLFNVLALVAPGLPHWAMPGWLFLFPPLGRLLADAAGRGRRWPLWFAGASATTLGALLLVAVLTVSNSRVVAGNPGLDGALAEATSWTGVYDGLTANGLLNRPGTFLAAMDWLTGARLAEATRTEAPVVVFGNDPRGFAFLGDPNAHLGEDAIIVAPAGRASAVEALARDHFTGLDIVGSFTTSKGGHPAFAETAWLARNFKTPVALRYGPWAR